MAEQVVEVERVEDGVPEGVLVRPDHDPDRLAGQDVRQELVGDLAQDGGEELGGVVAGPRPALRGHRPPGLGHLAADAVDLREVGEVVEPAGVPRAQRGAARQVFDRLGVSAAPQVCQRPNPQALRRLRVVAGGGDVRCERVLGPLVVLPPDVALGQCHRRFEVALQRRTGDAARQAQRARRG